MRRLRGLQKDVWHAQHNGFWVFCWIRQALSLLLFVCSFFLHSLLSALYISPSVAIFDLPSLLKTTNLSSSVVLSDFYDSLMILWVWSMAPFLYKLSSALLVFWVNSTLWIFFENSMFLTGFWKMNRTVLSELLVMPYYFLYNPQNIFFHWYIFFLHLDIVTHFRDAVFIFTYWVDRMVLYFLYFFYTILTSMLFLLLEITVSVCLSTLSGPDKYLDCH